MRFANLSPRPLRRGSGRGGAAKWMLALALALAGCGDSDSGSPIGVNNVSPTGSVGGIVLDASTLKPMQGVPVTVIAGARILPSAENPAQTDAEGRFSIDGIPTGDLIVQISPKANHQPVAIEATLINAAGEFPLANSTLSLGPLALIPLATADSAFKVQLINPDGSPAASVKAHLRTAAAWVDLATGLPTGRGTAVAEAQSDNTGLIRFTGMPDFLKIASLVGSGGVSDSVRVVLPPLDTNKDGVADFFGKEVTFSVTKQGAAVPQVILTSATPGALTIVASNIAGLMGKDGNWVLGSVSGPLFIAFNWPIDQKLTELSLFDEQGKAVPSAPTKTVTGNLMTINFQGLVGGSEYNLNLRTFALVEGTLLEGSFGSPLFTPTAAGAKVTATLKRGGAANPNRVFVTFSEPIGTGNAGQSLAGANAVLYFDADLNGGGTKGDAPGERGAETSNITLTIDEADPPGTCARSGLSKYWYYDLPLDPSNNPLAAGTAFDLLFTRTNVVVRRADGSSVPDLLNLSVPN